METQIGWNLIKWSIILFIMARWIYEYGGGERATLPNAMCLVWSISSGICLIFGVFEFIGDWHGI